MIAFVLSAACALQSEELAAAAKKASEAGSYAFKIESKGDGKGVNTLPSVEGRYEKDKAQALKVNGTESFRKAGLVVVKDGEAWKRLEKPAKGDKPAKGSLTIQTFGAIKLPHEELTDFEKSFEKVEKAEEGDLTVFTGALTAAGARTLVSSGSKAEGKARANFVYSGTGKVWVNKDGAIVKYEVAVKAKGTLKEKDVEQTITRTVQLSDVGTAKVGIPEAAEKALGAQS